MKRIMRMGAFFNPTGHHVASWRHPESQPDAGVNFAHHVELAKLAERGRFDMIFFADSLAVREADMKALSRSAQYIANFEPMTLISALAAVTKNIGLVCTASTSYTEPYNLARMFASIDHLSAGRAGWNIVTTSVEASAGNFGRESHFGHAERYERAREFTEICLGLWDSWDDDAFRRDAQSGIFFDPDKLHRLDHRGQWFSVRGPLNVPRPVQGYPVLVQAGASEDGRNFSAQFGEVLFTGNITLDSAQNFYADIKERAAKHGRDPDHVVVMPGLSPVVGRTEDEAREKQEYLQSLVHPIVAREVLGMVLGADLAPYDMDGPLPEDLPVRPAASQSMRKVWLDIARSENLTIRQLAMRAAHGRGKSSIVGTPQQVADHMQDWFENRGADGFNIQPPYQPGAFRDFVELVVPELQRRGLMRKRYTGKTLRENLGLPRPPSRHARRAETLAA